MHGRKNIKKRHKLVHLLVMWYLVNVLWFNKSFPKCAEEVFESFIPLLTLLRKLHELQCARLYNHELFLKFYLFLVTL